METQRKNKRDLITFFISKYPLRKKGVFHILLYLRGGEEKYKGIPERIDKIHFVDDIKYCPFAFEIHSEEDGFDKPITLHYQGVKYTEKKDIINKIDDFKGEIYINLNFPDKYGFDEYINALEENPFADKNDNFEEFEETTKEVIENANHLYKLEQIKKEIDIALFNRDKEKFMALTNKLFKLQKQKQ